MSHTVKQTLLTMAACALMVALMGIGGSGEFAEAKAQEKYICENRIPAPDYCSDLGTDR